MLRSPVLCLGIILMFDKMKYGKTYEGSDAKSQQSDDQKTVTCIPSQTV